MSDKPIHPQSIQGRRNAHHEAAARRREKLARKTAVTTTPPDPIIDAVNAEVDEPTVDELN